MNTTEEFLALLTDAAEDLGADLEANKEDVAAFMASRSDHLATITHEPGFGRAVQREAVAVAMEAGLNISDTASNVDQRWFGMIAGALRIAAVALV